LRKKWSGWLVSILCGALTASAFCVRIVVADQGTLLARLQQSLDGFGIVWLILAVVSGMLCYRVYFAQKRSFSLTAFIIALLFGLFMVIGGSYYALDNWDFLFANKYQFALSLFVLAGYVSFFYAGLLMLFSFVDSGKLLEVSSLTETKFQKFFRDRTLLFAWAVIFVCWIPVLVVYYPGSVPHDGFAQLNMYFGINTFTNHHPAFMTWLMGWFMQFGRFLGSDNLGIFSYVLAQSVFCAFAFALSIKYLGKLKVPMWLQITALVYFALFPVWPAYAQVEIKDTLFTGFFVLYTLQILVALKDSHDFFSKPGNVILLGISSLLLCMMRNNGLFIAVPVGTLLVFSIRRRPRVWAACSLAGALVLFWVYSSVLLPALGVKNGSIREALSIPFQQTARYLVEYGDDVTEAERAAIDAVLPYDQIAGNYDPQLSDPVKRLFRQHSTKGELATYFRTWFSMFFKHPDAYIQATLNNCYGYFYPDEPIEKMGTFQYYIKGAPVDTGYFSFGYAEGSSAARNAVKDYSYFFRQVPAVSLLYSPAAYTWILIVLCGLLLRKKRFRALVGLVPALLTVLICCASPVNGLVRYMLPVMATMPLLIGWTLSMLRPAEEAAGLPADPRTKNIREMFRFAISGGVCILVEYGCLIVLKEAFQVHYLVAAGAGFLLSVAFNYLLCVRWVFTDTRSAGRKAQVLFLITSLVGLAINQLLMWMLVDGLALYYIFAKMISSAVVMIWNYIAKRRVLVGRTLPDTGSAPRDDIPGPASR